MTASKRDVRTAVTAVLALTLTGCSDEAGPTGWIPRHGTISGVIAVSSTSPIPPQAAFRSTVGGKALVLTASPRIASLAPGMGASPVISWPARKSRAAATPNDLILTFRHTALGAPPLGAAALAAPAGARAFGAGIRSRLAPIVPGGAEIAGVSPVILAAKIRVADTTQRDGIAAALRRDPAIAAVTRNRLIWLDEKARASDGAAPGAAAAARVIPSDPLYPIQSWHYGLIDLPRAWSITTGSEAVLVAVVDDGIRNHPAIAANLTSDGYDFVNAADSLALCAGGTVTNAADGDGPDPDPTIPSSYSFDPTGDCFAVDEIGGHGLHVAGTIGAVGNDGVGVTGVSWTVRIRPVRGLGAAGFGTTYDIAQGVLYAAGLPADNGAGGTVQAGTGAKIVNLSLGGPGDDPTLHNAIISAANAGALIVAAAGNGSTDALHYPAAYPEVLAVAAIGPDGAPAGYSNFGSHVGIRAPGGNFAFVGATGGVASTLWDFAAGQPIYAFAEGTSMAAPHVAGVAALVLAQTPSLTAAALRSRLTSHATGPASPWGAGLVNAYNSLTQNVGPPAQRHARLYSATTGAIVQTVLAQPGGAFAFNSVEDGTYFLYGGMSDGPDRALGTPGTLWGAFGESAVPSAVTVLGSQPVSVSFSIGLPIQHQPNHTIQTANRLVIGGYIHGAIIDTPTADYYRVQIPEPATYTFETSGWVGACGFALEEGTAIGLFNAAGTLITSVGFIAPPLNRCSRLTRTLSPGTYYVGVAGAFGGGFFGGRYRLQARVGS